MSNVIEVCNRALASVRGKSINSLTEGSVEAQQCKLHFDTARQFVLRDNDWQFARKVAPLQLRSETPLHWVFTYQYPGDCLNLKIVTGDFAFKSQQDDQLANRGRFIAEFIEPELSVPFEIQHGGDGRIIVTDQNEAYAIYTADVDVALFDPLLVTALSHYLAMLIAVPVMGGDIGRAMRQDASVMYAQSISAAISASMNESRRPKRKLPALVTARM